MHVVRTLAQMLVAIVVAASVMPIILTRLPLSREPGLGVPIAGGVLLVSFGLIWLVWPRKHR